MASSKSTSCPWPLTSCWAFRFGGMAPGRCLLRSGATQLEQMACSCGKRHKNWWLCVAFAWSTKYGLNNSNTLRESDSKFQAAGSGDNVCLPAWQLQPAWMVALPARATSEEEKGCKTWKPGTSPRTDHVGIDSLKKNRRPRNDLFEAEMRPKKHFIT